MNLCDALSLACTVHHDQLDLCGEPYILHVVRVVNGLEFSDADEPWFRENARIVAALHDAKEDGGGVLLQGYLSSLLGNRWSIEAAIDAITHRPNEPYTDYIERVSRNRLAAVVKIADLTDNLQPWRKPLNESASKHKARRAKYLVALHRLRRAQLSVSASV